MSDDGWAALRGKLAEAEKFRNYEDCALLSLKLSDMAESMEMAHVWLVQAQVYATLRLGDK